METWWLHGLRIKSEREECVGVFYSSASLTKIKYLIVVVRHASPSSCHLVVSPVAVVVPPVALLPLAVAVLTPVAVVVPHVAVLPLAVVVPPVAVVAASSCHPQSHVHTVKSTNANGLRIYRVL